MATAAMKPLNVGVLGFGTVGRGTWDVLRRNEEEITRLFESSRVARSARSALNILITTRSCGLTSLQASATWRLPRSEFSVRTRQRADRRSRPCR